MSIFGRLFKKKSVIAVDDPVFGYVTFEQAIWTFVPNPPTEGFMITVDAPETGPSQLQRDFFQMIRASLPECERVAREFMRSRVHALMRALRFRAFRFTRSRLVATTRPGRRGLFWRCVTQRPS